MAKSAATRWNHGDAGGVVGDTIDYDTFETKNMFVGGAFGCWKKKKKKKASYNLSFYWFSWGWNNYHYHSNLALIEFQAFEMEYYYCCWLIERFCDNNLVATRLKMAATNTVDSIATTTATNAATTTTTTTTN